MADGVVWVAAISVFVAALMGLILMFKRRGVRPQMRAEVEKTLVMKPLLQAQPQVLQEVAIEAEAVAVALVAETAAPQPAPVIVPEDRKEKILAGISENLRRNPVKPLPRFSPIEFTQAPRETEYIRVKKQIITPHGQVRFSILKDTLSTNMLAVFRRASLDWKTPEDLIGFIPACLEPEAEVLNGRILLIGTPGHPEKLAIPIRSIDDDVVFRDCFELYSDVRPSKNAPAVVLRSGGEYEVVSKGTLTQILFSNPAAQEFALVQ